MNGIESNLVGNFMGYDENDALFGGRGRGVAIQQEGALAEERQSPVLHGAGSKVGNSDQVQFGQWVADTEEELEVVEQTSGRGQGEFGLLDHVRRRVNGQSHTALADVLDAGVVADHQRH